METVVDAFERDAWDEAHAAFSAVRPALSSLRGRYVLDAHGRAALPTMGTDVAMHQFLRGGFDNEAREAVALADVALQFSVVGHGYARAESAAVRDTGALFDAIAWQAATLAERAVQSGWLRSVPCDQPL